MVVRSCAEGGRYCCCMFTVHFVSDLFLFVSTPRPDLNTPPTRAMDTGFGDAILYQDIGMMKNTILAGADLSQKDFFDRTPIFGLRWFDRLTKEEYVDVLHALINAGAEVNHIDFFGNTLLLMTENDTLGVALVEVGASIDYVWLNSSKRGLANAAVYGCTRTIDAMINSRLGGPDEFKQQDFDTCLDRAARRMAFDGIALDMSGITNSFSTTAPTSTSGTLFTTASGIMLQSCLH